jgi:hypothetical protein
MRISWTSKFLCWALYDHSEACMAATPKCKAAFYVKCIDIQIIKCTARLVFKYNAIQKITVQHNISGLKHCGAKIKLY